MTFFDYLFYWLCVAFLALPSSVLVPAIVASYLVAFSFGYIFSNHRTKL